MEEIDKIKKDYGEGRLKEAENCLDTYVQMNRIHILEYQKAVEKRFNWKIDVITALKMHILDVRGIDPKQENKLQFEEMKLEGYYLGEKTGRQQDLAYVCSQWCKEHAPGWRDHRVYVYEVIIEKNREKYEQMLR